MRVTIGLELSCGRINMEWNYDAPLGPEELALFDSVLSMIRGHCIKPMMYTRPTMDAILKSSRENLTSSFMAGAPAPVEGEP